MKSFEYTAPKTVEEAVAMLTESWGQVELLAGGTDLITSMKQDLVSPRRVVGLKNVSSLKGIKASGKDVRIGAMTTLAELSSDPAVKQHFPALVTAATGIGSPQMLAMGTVGGDLCQRPRCWFFRNGYGLFAKNGDAPMVPDGDNRYHAIFGADGPAKFVSASSLGPPLIALGATVTIVGAKGKKRVIPAAEFFKTPQTDTERETALKPNEILAEIHVPIRGLKNATYEVRHRHGLDWPYVSATVVFAVKAGVASSSQVVLGHVAPVPWVAGGAAKSLDGQSIDASQAAKAGAAAVDGAKPLSGNAYKMQLVKTAVKRATLAAIGA